LCLRNGVDRADDGRVPNGTLVPLYLFPLLSGSRCGTRE
jgi:hypothetical protein